MVTDIRGVGPWEDSLKHVTTDCGGEHKHKFSGETETLGEGASINNLSPSIPLFIWNVSLN